MRHAMRGKVVRLAGIEPARPYEHEILSLGCLPIPPQSHWHTRPFDACEVGIVHHHRREPNATGPLASTTVRPALGLATIRRLLS
jgi:hypothetical protein